MESPIPVRLIGRDSQIHIATAERKMPMASSASRVRPSDRGMNQHAAITITAIRMPTTFLFTFIFKIPPDS